MLQRYQQNNRSVTVSWMLVLYSLVKTDIRASWKNGIVVTCLKILKLSSSAMEKPPNSLWFYVMKWWKILESERFLSHPYISLMYFELGKISYCNLNLFLSKFFWSFQHLYWKTTNSIFYPNGKESWSGFAVMDESIWMIASMTPRFFFFAALCNAFKFFGVFCLFVWFLLLFLFCFGFF